MSDICCSKQAHLPTGSSLSGRIASFAAKPAFDAVEEKVSIVGNRMSLYVDDITLSGPSATKGLLVDVRQIVRRHGLRTKNSKTRLLRLVRRKWLLARLSLAAKFACQTYGTRRLLRPVKRSVWRPPQNGLH
jgi:hypothetical protein